MRLLNIETFKLESYDNLETCPPYVILSHRWSENEVLYEDLQEMPNDNEVQDLQCRLRDMELRFESLERQLTSKNYTRQNSLQENLASLESKAVNAEASDIDSDLQYPHLRRAKKKSGWNKIRNFCKVIKTFGFSYGWADTCCINKESSSELSEAINSMFSWYSYSSLCIAYLGDISSNAAFHNFENSLWFTRGWTLQELIAPDDVWFYDGDWKFLGLRSMMARRISARTCVNERILHRSCQKLIQQFSIAARLSWAVGRSTTRSEDRVYSLLGLFNVNMPTLYGEGEQAAFFRMQVEVFNASPDHSIFAWGLNLGRETERYQHNPIRFPLFALGVNDFHKKGSVISTTQHLSQYQVETRRNIQYSQFVHGLRVLLLLRPYGDFGSWQACLGCTIGKGKNERVLTIILMEDQPGHFMRISDGTVPIQSDLLNDDNWALKEIFISPNCPNFTNTLYFNHRGNYAE